MAEPFRVGLTRDFLAAGITLDDLDTATGVAWEHLPTDAMALPPDAVTGYDALVVLGPRVTASTVAGNDRLALIARFGVGYDTVDIDACTAAGILVTITPDGVRHPVAVGALTLLLALAHQVRGKDALVRANRWGDRFDHIGLGLTGRTLGIVGFGNIGQEVSRVCAPLGMRHLASDPYRTGHAEVSLVGLEELLTEADVVVLTCALTPATRHLINSERIAVMKPTAYLVNVARGPVVDQAALTAALTEGRIAGAALDVFDTEPVSPDDPLLTLDNVLLSPHTIAWTDEVIRGNGRSAVRAVLDVAAGRVPSYPVNPEALGHPRLSSRLSR